jgi:RHS repeat-associated protein
LRNELEGRGQSPLDQLTYAYNPVGNITSIADLTDTRAFAYDALDRVIRGGTDAAPETYEYDPVGNRVRSFLSATHAHDRAGRLLEDDQFRYTYDANGNLTTKTAKVSGAVTTYRWDALNRLIRIELPDGTSAAYRYDGFGRRIEKNVNGVITRYVYDGFDILLEYDGANQPVARYGHGPRMDQPLVLQRDGESLFYHADHLGSVRLLSDASGAAVNTYRYDSYGRGEGFAETVANPFTYTGREFDAESGLYYYRARYYDPEIGRFISEDPLGLLSGDPNLYAYVLGNPLNHKDPLGMVVLPVVVGLALTGLLLLGAAGAFLTARDIQAQREQQAREAAEREAREKRQSEEAERERRRRQLQEKIDALRELTLSEGERRAARARLERDPSLTIGEVLDVLGIPCRKKPPSGLRPLSEIERRAQEATRETPAQEADRLRGEAAFGAAIILFPRVVDEAEEEVGNPFGEVLREAEPAEQEPEPPPGGPLSSGP